MYLCILKKTFPAGQGVHPHRVFYPFMLKKYMANCADSDQTPQKAAFDQGLYCLHDINSNLK